MATRANNSIGLARSAAPKDFDFNITSEWLGYNSSLDKTNAPENVMVQGSQNFYKKLSGTLAVRPGLLRIGAPNAALSPVSSEFVWNTSWGATLPLWISNGMLQVFVNGVWYTLLSSLTKTRYVFDKWFSQTEKKDRVLFVKGDSDIQHWSGGVGFVLSATANTITVTGSLSWANLGFSTVTGEKKIMIAGTEYTYTGGETTTTLTGVTPDPSAIVGGTIALQSVLTATGKPFASGFNNDFLKVINNRVWVGSYTSRLVPNSSATDFTLFTVPPSPTPVGSPNLTTLDGTARGIAIKDGNPYIGYGTGEWVIVTFPTFNDSTGALYEQITRTPLPVAKLAAPLAHEFIANNGNNIIYLSQDQQLRELGDFNNLFVTGFPTLSQEIATEMAAEVFTGGGVKCIGDFTYMTAPNSGKTYLYQTRQRVNDNTVSVERLWHSPFVINASRVDEFLGKVVVFSNANPQMYQMWDTNQYHDDSPSGESLSYTSILALGYRNGARRQGLLSFDKIFTEGYMARGSLIDLLINYDWLGATGQIMVPLNSISNPAFLFKSAFHSLGDSILGNKPLGDEIIDKSSSINFPKFKVINSLALTNCFEYQPIFMTESIDAYFEILAVGTNAKVEAEANATYIINKKR